MRQDRPKTPPTRGTPVTDTTADTSPEGLLFEPAASAPTDGRGYRRVLLKLSGEAFGGGSVGVDGGIVHSIAEQLAEVVHGGTQVAVVVGGGNFFRGAELAEARSEERRVGKECRSRWSPYH